MHIPDTSVQDKVRKLVSELNNDLVDVDRQEKLHIISKVEATSIRKSIQQSIDELRRILCA